MVRLLSTVHKVRHKTQETGEINVNALHQLLGHDCLSHGGLSAWFKEVTYLQVLL